MDKSFVFKISKGTNNETIWFYDTIFTIHEENQEIDLSDGDCDSSVGDLEEWDFVSFENIPKVNSLFAKKYPNFSNFNLSDEQKAFYETIKHEAVKELFTYLCIYCVNDKGNMSSFRQLLDENGIENNYSVYRSSGE